MQRHKDESAEEKMNTYEEIISAALSLPPGARAMLAEHLLKSLDAEDQERIDSLWAAEAERRIKEIEDGIVTPIPGDQVMRRLRSRNKR
jgi:putative addiction module component (TIGR02574 family)